MGQAECLEYLEKKKGQWVPTQEIADALGQSKVNINPSLRTLFKYKEIERRRIKYRDGCEWKAT